VIELTLVALGAGFLMPLPGARPEQRDLKAHEPITAIRVLLQIEEQRPRSVATGPQLIHDDKLEAALEVYVQAVEAAPKSASANKAVGLVLDLLGRYTEARKYFNQAIKVARSPAEKAQMQRALAVSFGFERDCRGAVKADTGAYDYYLESHDFYNAGEVADEVGRLCLDAGDMDTAYDWYGKGHAAGLEELNISTEHLDLWDFRWAHARARIAARRGKLDEARKFVAIARTILEKGTNPAQKVYFPYLAGYVAFYAGDYKSALADLRDSTPDDPFIECLIAQSYEKLGDRDTAREYYARAANTNTHSVPEAFARPFARSKLQ
jgi:tetratricopeptide (TPR) repeat protein